MLTAELQAFSYSYLLFKELAAVKDQAGAHAYACWEERSWLCLLWHAWSYAWHLLLGVRVRAAGTRTSGGVRDTHTAANAHATYRNPDSERSWTWLAKIEQLVVQLGHPRGRGVLVLPEGAR